MIERNQQRAVSIGVMRDKHQATAAAATSLGNIRAQPKLPNILHPTSNTEMMKTSCVRRLIYNNNVQIECIGNKTTIIYQIGPDGKQTWERPRMRPH